MILELQENRDNPALALPHFPVRYQAVIWRNWGLVPVGKIAEVLGATVAQIREAAAALGLAEPAVNIEAKWQERGYITIIRDNWHLLPVAQLLQLLGWTEERLSFTLKEDDFLWIKLGSLKPWTESVRYRELTAAERKRTEQLKEVVAAGIGKNGEASNTRPERLEQPFDFLAQYKQTVTRHIPGREAAADEIRLDVPWTIEVPIGMPLIAASAERFVNNHAQAWGVRWAIREEQASRFAAEDGPVVRFAVAPDASRLAESHTIAVEADEITIGAVDEAGSMRGLQWLAGQMKRTGVPYVIAGTYRRNSKIDTRIIYSYSAVYGDPFLEPELDPYPDELLERLSELGVNGVWLQSVLYSLVPWVPALELSVDWEKRIVGLRLLVMRAAKYGIGVYLYCNEPRSMPVSFFDSRPEWQGHTEDGQAMLCTSHPEVQELLSGAVSFLFREVPDLAGLFTISMSENWTHCYSRAAGGQTNCPRCSKRSPGEVTSEVNRLIAQGAFREKPDARILVWTWGWAADWGWTDEEFNTAIAGLPNNVTVMCVSEEAIPTNIAGIPGKVIDYSISVIGPGEKSLQTWQRARARGLRTAAKVQFNNTWECSAIPFLPVFQQIETHLNRLAASGVSTLMLSWTLGGYPSLNLELAAEYYWETEATRSGIVTKSGVSELLQGKFGDAAGRAIIQATAAFSQAFREFPFELSVLYVAPQNYGPANLLHLQPTGQTATMIGYPYDDLAGWRSIYPESSFAAQFKKLSVGWKKGLGLLEKARKHVPRSSESDFDDMATAATGAYLHFYSTYLQIEFVRARNRYLTSKSADVRLKACRKLIALAVMEADNVRQLLALVNRDSRIGFEASNHYYYTVQDLMEKMLNCAHITGQLRQAEADIIAGR
ncbi:hypothetical protein [Cohnella soli]|uniref:Beta-hexosaminidase bacterial type N-terminal domain-containing protein n=1 Tax=Cohnella soli TaxID=425005 RepID=A0ABW0I595_9BACL